MFKKFISIIIITVLLFNAIGNLIVFESMRYTIKKEVKSDIISKTSDHNLITIIVDTNTKKNIRFMDDDEFMYNGRMYDIVKQENKNDTTIYLCSNDTKEDELFANLNTEVKKNMDTNPVKQKTQQILTKISISLFYEEVNNDHPDTYSSYYYKTKTQNILTTDYDVLTPPPKVINN